jgi:hypothetical protein
VVIFFLAFGEDAAMLARFVALIFLILMTDLSAEAASPEADTEADEEVLRAARLPTDGPGLLTVFGKRTPDAESQEHITMLIAQLGSASFSEREEASEELAACDVEAVGLLREAARHRDLEIRRRAREALALIEPSDLAEHVFVSALRVLARQKPPRMTEVLLAYSPHAASLAVSEELGLALSSVAVRDGEVDANLVRALTAKSSSQRGVAAEALCRAGCRKQMPAVRGLLRDPDPHLRRRVALALLEAREKAAVPVLIDLLAELSSAEAEPIESVLLQLAGDNAPVGQAFQPDAPKSQAGKPDLRDPWAGWWKRHGDDLNLAKIELSPRWRGYILAVCLGVGRGRAGRAGCILELDARGRTRWQMPGLAAPVDAQVLDERRVLVTESRISQITERNHNGEILRRIDVPDFPLEARRLPNGRTLITTRSRVFEVDQNDKEVWAAKGNANDSIVAACPLPGGEIGICYRNGEFVRQKRDGKIVASFQVGRLFRTSGTHIQGLANGHVLVPLYYDNKVVEFDGNGREVWSASFEQPASAQRLPNGRTLVAGYASNSIVELDRDGREVKSLRCDGRLMYVSGR